MKNPMIPERKQNDVSTTASNNETVVNNNDAKEDPNLDLLRKAWDFRNPVHISRMLVPDEKTVCSAISYCSIAASCGIFSEEQMQMLKTDLLRDLQTVTEHQRAYMILHTIVLILHNRNDKESQEILSKLSEILGFEC